MALCDLLAVDCCLFIYGPANMTHKLSTACAETILSITTRFNRTVSPINWNPSRHRGAFVWLFVFCVGRCFVCLFGFVFGVFFCCLLSVLCVSVFALEM